MKDLKLGDSFETLRQIEAMQRDALLNNDPRNIDYVSVLDSIKILINADGFNDMEIKIPDIVPNAPMKNYVDMDLLLVDFHAKVLKGVPFMLDRKKVPLQLTDFTKEFVGNLRCVAHYVSEPKGNDIRRVLDLYAQASYEWGRKNMQDAYAGEAEVSNVPHWRRSLKR